MPGLNSSKSGLSVLHPSPENLFLHVTPPQLSPPGSQRETYFCSPDFLFWVRFMKV